MLLYDKQSNYFYSERTVTITIKSAVQRRIYITINYNECEKFQFYLICCS